MDAKSDDTADDSQLVESIDDTDKLDDSSVTPDIPPPPADYKPRCKVYTREEWGARPSEWSSALELPVKSVVLSRTETEPCFTEEECKQRVRELQRAHMVEEGLPDIKYNFLIGGDGALYEGRGYTMVGPTYPESPGGLEKLNRKSIDISYITTLDVEVPDIMLQAVYDCITIGAVGRFIAKRFDIYWVAGDEIQHKESPLGELGYLPLGTEVD